MIGRRFFTIFNSECDEDPEEIVNAHISLALAYLYNSQPEMAARTLTSSAKHEKGYVLRNVLWKMDTQARIALKSNQASEAQKLFSELLHIAQGAYHYEIEWRATIGIAQSLVGQNKHQEALKNFDEAEKLLLQSSLRVAVDEGRAAFLAQRQTATQNHVELLLKIGKKKEAMNVVRRARSRALQSTIHASRIDGMTPAQKSKWENALARYWKEREKLLS